VFSADLAGMQSQAAARIRPPAFGPRQPEGAGQTGGLNKIVIIWPKQISAAGGRMLAGWLASWLAG